MIQGRRHVRHVHVVGVIVEVGFDVCCAVVVLHVLDLQTLVVGQLASSSERVFGKERKFVLATLKVHLLLVLSGLC